MGGRVLPWTTFGRGKRPFLSPVGELTVTSERKGIPHPDDQRKMLNQAPKVRAWKECKTVSNKVQVDKLTRTHPALGPRTLTRCKRAEVQAPSLIAPCVIPAAASADVAGEGGGVGGGGGEITPGGNSGPVVSRF